MGGEEAVQDRPMSDNIITKDDRQVIYPANAGQVAFPVTFKFQRNEDLTVEILHADETTTRLTLNVDYAVTGAGNDTGGTVTLTHGATGGTIFRITGSAELTM